MDTTLSGERNDGTTMLCSAEQTEKLTGFRSFAMTADQIQSFNPLFIVLMVPVSVWIFKTLDRAGWKVKATHKMTLGFVLTASTMAIMSFSGYLAGTKLDAIKLITAEGEFIFPAASKPLDSTEILTKDSADPKNQNALILLGESVKLSASSYSYDAEKKKGNFTSGTFVMSDGKKLVLNKGGIDFTQSTMTAVDGRLTIPGTLETLFKPGVYAKDKGSYAVGEGNRFEERTESPKLEKDEKADEKKALIEKVDWVKPSERVTLWWQVLAFLILTVAEILISVTGLELAFVAAPPTMKSFVTACWLVTVFLANLLVNAPITRLYTEMPPGKYFALLTGIMAVVILVFIPVAIKFNKAMAVYDADKKAADAEFAKTEAE